MERTDDVCRGTRCNLVAQLVSIFVAPTAGAPMQSLDWVDAVAGRGLVGDRYASGQGTFSGRMAVFEGAREVSLIDRASIAICNQRLQRQANNALHAPDLRRNLVIEGMRLIEHKDQYLAIGDVVLQILGSCPPCGYLSRLLDTDMRRALRGIGGVRARVETGGVLRVGAAVSCLSKG